MKFCLKPYSRHIYSSQRDFIKTHKLPVSNYVDFNLVSKNILIQLDTGIDKIILPVERVDYKVELTFSTIYCPKRNSNVVKIDSNCQAINNCCPNFSGIHKYLRDGFTESISTKFNIEIDYVEIENLGELIANNSEDL